MKKPKRPVGQELLRLRRERGLNQLDLAIAIGRDNAFISRIEAGKQAPSVQHLKKIARALKLSGSTSDDLYFLAGYLPPEVSAAIMSDHAIFAGTVDNVRLEAVKPKNGRRRW